MENISIKTSVVTSPEKKLEFESLGTIKVSEESEKAEISSNEFKKSKKTN